MKTSFDTLYGQPLSTSRPNYGDKGPFTLATDENFRIDIQLPVIPAGEEYRLRVQLVSNDLGGLVMPNLTIREMDGDVLAQKKATSSNPKVDLIVDADNSGQPLYFVGKVTDGGNTSVNISFQEQV